MEFFYNPDLMTESELTATFVAREEVVDEVVNSITSQQGKSRHVLLVAPRGMGKTTLLLMIRLAFKRTELREKWQVVKFPEESYGIYDVADFWTEVINNLAVETKDAELTTRIEKIKAEQAQSGRLEEAALAEVKEWQKEHGKNLALLVENYDQILDQIGDETSLKRLHKTLCSDGSISLVVCATTYLNRGHRDSHARMFKTVELHGFKFNDIKNLLIRRAEQDGHPEFKETIESNVTRLQVLEYFTGGNPRLVLMLYRVLAYSDISEVRQALEKLLDEITPYYKSKVELLPSQQRKILDHIARASSRTGVGITPTEIAGAVRLSPNQVSAQLKRLAEMGYVRAADIPGRKSFYLLSQPLFAVWYQMRMGRAARQRMLWFIDFLKGWYKLEELRRRAVEQAEHFRVYIRTNRLPEAQRVLEYQRYLAEAIHDNRAKASVFSRIIKEYLEIQDKQTVKEELLPAIDPQLLSEDTRLALHHAGLITFHELYNVPASESLPSHEAKMRAEADAANALGTATLQKRQYETAVKHYQQAIEIEPSYFRSWRNCGIAFHSQDKKQEALACFERALDLKSDLPGTWVDKGNILRELNRREEALASYNKALELEPDNFEALYFKAVTLQELERAEEALEYFEQAIQVRPLSRRALAFKVSILMELERYEEAIKTADDTLKIKPDFHESWSVRGLVCFIAHRHEEAVKSFERALELGMDSETISPEYMVSLSEVGRHDDALKWADRAIEKDPDDVIAMLIKGIAMNEMEEYEEAVLILTRVLERQDDIDKAWYERGYAHMQQEHIEEAISDYDRALAINPTHYLTRLYRSYLYDVQFANSLLREEFCQAEKYWIETIKIFDGEDAIGAFLLIIEDHWPLLIKSGRADFILKMIKDYGLEQRLFPLVRALNYLDTRDETLLETTASEFQKAVQLITSSFEERGDKSE